jgi:hypothetical protein
MERLMTYRLKENTDDGSVDLIENRPVVIANFKDMTTAARVVELLELDDAGAIKKVALAADPTPKTDRELREAVTADASPEDLAKVEPPEVEEHEKSIAQILQEELKKEKEAPKPDPAEPSDDEWEAACCRVRDGEKLTDVAADIGVEMPKLRGKYGAFKRGRQPSEPTEEAPPEALLEGTAPADREQEECRLCGREFMSAGSTDGLCARCDSGRC